MQTQSKITNEAILKKAEAKMAGEIGCLNLLSKRTNSPLTIENVFKFKESPQWEVEAELIKAQKECKGHLKHLLPQVEQEIRESYTEEYFEQIEKCFEDCPKGLQPSDVELKGGVLSYTPAYVETRLAVATMELSEDENEIYSALCDARVAVAKLKSVLGNGMWSGEFEYLISSEKDTAEVGFEHFSQQRIRKSLKNI